MSAPHYLVHNTTDTVGVVVVEGLEAGQEAIGWLMETDETIRHTTKDAIPIGHKIALGDIADGDTIIKYGHDIGKAVAAIGEGGHVHVHNMKTKRW
jgi:(2R)-sulfolactate sulfo-lyase subunit alpha